MSLYFGFAPFGAVAFGQDRDLSTYSLSLSAAAFTLTTQPVGLRATRSMSISAGSFSWTMGTAGLSLAMRVLPAAFSVTLQAAGTTATRRLSITADPTPAYQYLLFSPFGVSPFGGVGPPAAATTFALTFGSVFLRKGFSLPVSTGSYTLTMQGADLDRIRLIQMQPAAVALAFQPVALRLAMPFATGSFSIAFQIFHLGVVTKKIRRFPRVGHATTRARSIGADVKVKVYGG